jgi:hypothetical protein
MAIHVRCRHDPGFSIDVASRRMALRASPDGTKSFAASDHVARVLNLTQRD